MSQSEPPRRQEPYLSTEDIIRRVRMAQGRAYPFLVFRGPLAVLGSLVVIVALLMLLHRAREREHQRTLEAAQQQDAQPPVLDEPASPAAAPPSAAGEQAEPAAAAPPSEQPAADAAQGQRVPLQVTIVGRPGIISLDGHRLTVDRRWSGRIFAGKHQLTVRCGSLTLRRRFEAESQPVNLSFDCSGRRKSP